MNTRRITLGLGAAAGGLLAAAYLPVAAANAVPSSDIFGNLFGTGTTDPFTSILGDFGGTTTPPLDSTAFGLDPITGTTGAEQVLTVSGLPPLDQQVEGYQNFDFFGTDTTSPTTAVDLGTAHTDVSTLTTPIGFENTEYLVNSVTPATGDTFAPGAVGVPGDGSTFDIAQFDGFANVYSDVVSGTGATATNAVTDTFVTPFGSFDVTPFIDSFAASGLLGGDSFLGAIPIDLAGIGDIVGTGALDFGGLFP